MIKNYKKYIPGLILIAYRLLTPKHFYEVLMEAITYDGDCTKCKYNTHNCQENCEEHLLDVLRKMEDTNEK